jgi:hypothetical protein
MEKHKINPELKKFLKKEGVYEKFVANVDEYWSKIKTINKRPFDTIIDAFLWYKTPEGFEFWKDLDDKYNEATKVS